MEKKVPEQSKSKKSDVKTLKEGPKASLTSRVGSVETRRENGVRGSTNGRRDLYVDNLGDAGDSGSVQESGSFLNAEDEAASDSIGSDDDGVSLLVDVSTEMGKIGEKEGMEFGDRENYGYSNENAENLDEVNDSNEGEEEDLSDGQYDFSVGDFVWGKIKSHPWWPGRIYDSSNASDYALKVRHRDRVLVAYFDGTFAWCHRYQLKPFAENFEEMSKQSTSKNFVNAVQKAVDEIGRLVELKITCSCVPKESLTELARPLATNSGIKQGVLVPEGGIAKLWTYLFGPEECLTELKHVAQVVSVTNLLEFTELKCWLSAFYRAKGGCKLALFHEPQPIPGLEDKNQNRVSDTSYDKNMKEVPIQGPLEEETDQSLLKKCLGDSENGQYQRRKQKSIAEIMEGNVDARAKNVEEDVAKERTGSVYPATSSGTRKRKSKDEAIGGSNLSSKPKRRKVTKLLESTLVTGSEMPSVERDGGKAKEETKKAILSRENRTSKGSSIGKDRGGGKEETDVSPVSLERKRIQRDDGEAKEEIEKGFLSRERKRSKYLSPPYTSINRKQSKKDIEAESLKVSSEAQMAEQMENAAVNRIGSGSLPTLMCSDEVANKKDSKVVGEVHEISEKSSPETVKLDESLVIDAMKVKVSTNKVISGIRSLAIDLYSLKDKNSLDVVKGFLSAFRSSVYCNGSNYKIYNKSHPGKRRKTLDSQHGLLAKFRNQTDKKSTEQTTRQKKIKKNEEEKSGMAKFKQAATSPEMKAREEETEGKAASNKHKPKQATKAQDKKRIDKETGSEAAPAADANGKGTDAKASPASLFVTFGPGSILPSKDDLIKIYSKFGSLNEEETDMFYTNFRARVVFLRSSDAEDALNISQLASPFNGASNVRFRLQSSSSTKMQKLKELANAKPLSAKGGTRMPEKESSSKSSLDQASPFIYVRQKLETIASVLENSDGKISPDLKSELEGEVNDLLEKVNTLVGSSSS